MANTVLYLIRHGEVENPENIIYGKKNLPLSRSGRLDIQNTAQSLNELRIRPKIIVASPLRRTDESAKIFADVFGIRHVNILYNNNLQEVDFGEEIVGKPAFLFADVNHNLYTHTVPGQPRSRETPEQFTQRTLAVLKEVTESHRGENIFVVGHGDPLSFALWALKHPDQPLPSTTYLQQRGMQLGKSDAARVEINENNGIESIDFYRLREGTLHIEGYPDDMDHHPGRRK